MASIRPFIEGLLSEDPQFPVGTLVHRVLQARDSGANVQQAVQEFVAHHAAVQAAEAAAEAAARSSQNTTLIFTAGLESMRS